MTSEPRLRDAEGGFEFEPHHCFACGDLNEQGLHLQLHAGPEGSWTELTLEPRFQGWDSVAHGGIVCTILDEVMAWSVIGRGTWGVTARLTVAFKRPIHTGRRIRAEGWVIEQHRRASRASGHIVDAATREVLATGESTFIALPDDQLDRLKRRYGMRRLPGASDDARGGGAAARGAAARGAAARGAAARGTADGGVGNGGNMESTESVDPRLVEVTR